MSDLGVAGAVESGKPVPIETVGTDCTIGMIYRLK